MTLEDIKRFTIMNPTKRELMIMQAVVKWGDASKIDFQTTAKMNNSTPILDLIGSISDLMYEVENIYRQHYEARKR